VADTKISNQKQQPGYKLIGTLTSAIQKQVIKNVVLYVENKRSKI